MEEFILADMEHRLEELRTQESDVQYFERLNVLLRDAESKAISREQIGPLNPHIYVKNGAKWKVFVKRIVRKLIWWFICPVVEQQNWHNELSNSISNELRDSICLLKELAEENYHLHTELEGVVDQIENLRKKQLSAEENVFDYIDYCTFEDIFRGTQEEIRSRIRRYLEHFEPGEKVLDLGFGRGEWLELLADKGIAAVGVDISEGFISMCRNKGLNVIQEDMFSYLESQPDCSLDGITAIQVVEHISPAALARLVRLSYRKLKLGGRVIFETQNPMSVSTLANNFYIDPTHIRPVHPRWLEYLFHANSFSEVYTEYPEYAWVTDGSIPALPDDDERIKSFNQRISYLNNFLYGSTDYAVIARK